MIIQWMYGLPILLGPPFSATPTLRAPHVYHVDLSADPNKQILIVTTLW